MYCGEHSAVNSAPGDGCAVSLRCKCWGCEECRPINRWALVKKGRLGKPDTFITLTSNPHWFEHPAYRAQQLVRAWRHARDVYRRWKSASDFAASLRADGEHLAMLEPREFMRRWRAEAPKADALPFLAVFEATKLGEPHLHILCRADWVDQRWLSAIMKEQIGAPIVDVRRVRQGDRALLYVSKYIGKSPHRFSGTKRYWTSLDYIPSYDKRRLKARIFGDDWQYRQVHLDQIEDELLQAGYAVRRYSFRLVFQDGEFP